MIECPRKRSGSNNAIWTFCEGGGVLVLAAASEKKLEALDSH